MNLTVQMYLALVSLCASALLRRLSIAELQVEHAPIASRVVGPTLFILPELETISRFHLALDSLRAGAYQVPY
jgi:hypothetical protein